MKKPGTQLLLCAALVLLAFTLGISLGKAERSDITVTQTTRVLPGETGEFSFLVNINTASAQELAMLPGIGEVFAQNITAYREANGNFLTPEELLNVEGIGPSRLEAILDYITVGGTP